jgi:hypothetical protein
MDGIRESREARRGRSHRPSCRVPASAAQAIAAEGLNRRVRRPQVTDGIPSATIRSRVAKLTAMIAAISPPRDEALSALKDERTRRRCLSSRRCAHVQMPSWDPCTQVD